MKAERYDAALLVAVFLACWQIVFWLTGPDVVSSPLATLTRAATLLHSGNFWHDAAGTGVAFAYACIIGILESHMLIWREPDSSCCCFLPCRITHNRHHLS